MPTIKLPSYIVWRDGKPRFVPGKSVRELGFAGQDLKHPSGAWFTLPEANAWGTAKLAEIAARRDGGAGAATTPVPGAGSPSRPPTRSIERLLLDFLAAPLTKETIAPSTYEFYRHNVTRVLYRKQTPAERKARKPRVQTLFAQMPVDRLKPIYVSTFLEDIRQKYSVAAARQVRALLAAAWAWGSQKSLEWQLGPSPVARQKLPPLKGRRITFSPDELEHMIRVADYIGEHAVGDCMLLGKYTAQRLGDRLELEDDGLKEGRRVLTQSKTGKTVSLPEPKALAERLKAARVRKAELALRLGRKLPANIVIYERTGEPFNRYIYDRRYELVRAAAVAGIKDPANPGKWIMSPMPSLAGKCDKDLRSTAITWMYRAGSAINSIRKISGHSYAGISIIIKHYLGEDPADAPGEVDNVMRNLERWEARQ